MNFEYRWFCRPDLMGRIPDHSTFSKNRHGRFRESDLLRHVFESTVARCIKEGLAGCQGLSVGASLIAADVQKRNSSNPEDWAAREIDPADAPRAVREYLDTLDDEAFGAATAAAQPKFTAHADPASQWTPITGSSSMWMPPGRIRPQKSARCERCSTGPKNALV